MEKRDFQTLSQKAWIRELHCALERSCWMQHNPSTGKGASTSSVLDTVPSTAGQAGLGYHL